MIVRCGRCGIELEVAGSGEFMCPSCGTRNVVRGPAQQPPASPFGVPDLGGLGGLSGTRPSTPPSEEAPSSISWTRCPSCRYRFAHGEVETVPCPVCGTEFSPGETEASTRQE